MSRKSREISPTGVYHVMLRGINRGRIFDDEQDCRKFVKILHQVAHPKGQRRCSDATILLHLRLLPDG